MEIKKYICGLCKKQGIETGFTRKGLRDHLRKEHFIKKRLTNTDLGDKKKKQKWWITEELD